MPRQSGVTSRGRSNTVASILKSFSPSNHGGYTSSLEYRVWQTTTPTQRETQTAPPPRKTTQIFWCPPPLGTSYIITNPISPALSGGTGPPLASRCCQRAVYFTGNWRFPPFQAPGPAPGTPSPLLTGQEWRLEGGAFSLPLYFILWFRGVPPPLLPRVSTYHTTCTGGGFQVPRRVPLCCPPHTGTWNLTGGCCNWLPSLDSPPPGSQWSWPSVGMPSCNTFVLGGSVSVVEACPGPTCNAGSRGGRT